MISKIQSIRGMKDYIPDDVLLYEHIENIIKNIFKSYGYNEIRFPIVENSLLFNKAIGDVTDIIKKEMYTFLDKKGNSLSLRPEGTAGCVRFSIQNGLIYNKIQKFWYLGPMFRYERPQKGRYRQFHQIGVEVFGVQDTSIDSELILIVFRIFNLLGIINNIRLEINSIGSNISRVIYKQELKKFLINNINKLDIFSKNIIDSDNILRIFDTKNLNIKQLLNKAPVITDYLDNKSIINFQKFKKTLDLLNIPYVINTQLVRGLDYYNDIIFEWISTAFVGSQNTICGGGRYDTLVKKMGGKDFPGIGFSIGLERLILLIKSINVKYDTSSSVDIYIIVEDNILQDVALILSEKIRNYFPKLLIIRNVGNKTIKKQLNYIIKCKAYVTLIITKKNNLKNKIIVKNIKIKTEQEIYYNNIIDYLKSVF